MVEMDITEMNKRMKSDIKSVNLIIKNINATNPMEGYKQTLLIEGVLEQILGVCAENEGITKENEISALTSLRYLYNKRSSLLTKLINERRSN